MKSFLAMTEIIGIFVENICMKNTIYKNNKIAYAVGIIVSLAIMWHSCDSISEYIAVLVPYVFMMLVVFSALVRSFMYDLIVLGLNIISLIILVFMIKNGSILLGLGIVILMIMCLPIVALIKLLKYTINNKELGISYSGISGLWW